MDISEFLISEEATMLEAMAQLDRVAKKVLFVVREDRFVAAITDGDIRRWILKKGSLDAKVRDIANYSPKSLPERKKGKAREYMKKHSIEALPIVDKNNNIVSIVLGLMRKSAEKTFKHPCRYYGRRPWNKALPVYENPSQTVDSNRGNPCCRAYYESF